MTKTEIKRCEAKICVHHKEGGSCDFTGVVELARNGKCNGFETKVLWLVKGFSLKEFPRQLAGKLI